MRALLGLLLLAVGQACAPFVGAERAGPYEAPSRAPSPLPVESSRFQFEQLLLKLVTHSQSRELKSADVDEILAAFPQLKRGLLSVPCDKLGTEAFSFLQADENNCDSGLFRISTISPSDEDITGRYFSNCAISYENLSGLLKERLIPAESKVLPNNRNVNLRGIEESKAYPLQINTDTFVDWEYFFNDAPRRTFIIVRFVDSKRCVFDMRIIVI